MYLIMSTKLQRIKEKGHRKRHKKSMHLDMDFLNIRRRERERVLLFHIQDIRLIPFNSFCDALFKGHTLAGKCCDFIACFRV